jgi:hypothetical protein
MLYANLLSRASIEAAENFGGLLDCRLIEPGFEGGGLPWISDARNGAGAAGRSCRPAG